MIYFSISELTVRKWAHQAAGNFLSSSSSESLWMVMMLTAGLGVSEMMMGWDWSPAKAEVLWTTVVVEWTEDTGLEGTKFTVTTGSDSESVGSFQFNLFSLHFMKYCKLVFQLFYRRFFFNVRNQVTYFGGWRIFFFFFYTSDNFCFCMWKQWKHFFSGNFSRLKSSGGGFSGKTFFWQIEEFLSCKTEFEKVWLEKNHKRS